jgi:hypothetical protein
VLAKYVPLIFLPAQLVYLWRTRQSTARLAMSLGMGVLVAGLIGWLLYAPLWAGSATFDGVRGAGQASESAMPAGLLFQYLARTRQPEDAAQLTTTILSVICGLVILFLSWRVRNGDSLAGACAISALAYVLIASPSYWPWYVALPIALLALVPRGVSFWMVLILTLTSRAVAPLSDLAANGFLDWPQAINLVSGIGTSLPLAAGLLLWLWHWWSARRVIAGTMRGTEKVA